MASICFSVDQIKEQTLRKIIKASGQTLEDPPFWRGAGVFFISFHCMHSLFGVSLQQDFTCRRILRVKFIIMLQWSKAKTVIGMT